jgi:hypothetical protein
MLLTQLSEVYKSEGGEGTRKCNISALKHHNNSGRRGRFSRGGAGRGGRSRRGGRDGCFGRSGRSGCGGQGRGNPDPTMALLMFVVTSILRNGPN